MPEIFRTSKACLFGQVGLELVVVVAWQLFTWPMAGFVGHEPSKLIVCMVECFKPTPPESGTDQCGGDGYVGGGRNLCMYVMSVCVYSPVCTSYIVDVHLLCSFRF